MSLVTYIYCLSRHKCHHVVDFWGGSNEASIGQFFSSFFKGMNR